MSRESPYDDCGIRIWYDTETTSEHSIISDAQLEELKRGKEIDDYTFALLDSLTENDVNGISETGLLDSDPFESLADSFNSASEYNSTEEVNILPPEQYEDEMFVPTCLRNIGLASPQSATPTRYTRYRPYIHKHSSADQFIGRYSKYSAVNDSFKYVMGRIIPALPGYNSQRALKPKHKPPNMSLGFRILVNRDMNYYLQRLQKILGYRLQYSVQECVKIRQLMYYLGRKRRAGDISANNFKKKACSLKKLAFAQFIKFFQNVP